MKVIISYDLTSKSPVQKTRIIRALFGYEDRSNFGKYKYVREGLISKIPTALPVKSAIAVEKVHTQEVIRILKKLKVKPRVLDMYGSQ
jgi:hypothetical protein